MALVALTDIVHGTDTGDVIKVAKGEKIPVTINGDALNILKEIGSVGQPVVTPKEVENKDAQIEELKRQLAEAQAAVVTANKGATTGQGGNEKPPVK